MCICVVCMYGYACVGMHVWVSNVGMWVYNVHVCGVQVWSIMCICVWVYVYCVGVGV